MTPPPSANGGTSHVSAPSNSTRATSTRTRPAAMPSSEKPFSGSAPPQKQQRASSLAATESAASPFVAPLTSAARAANKKPAPAIVTTVPSRTSPTAGVAAAGASVGGVWYANETPSARRVWRRAAWRG